MASETISETCIFCSGSDLSSRRQTVAGEKVVVCQMCAAFGHAALKDDPSGSFLRCLHLTAMEIERCLPIPERRSRRERRLGRELEARFSSSAFRMQCACATCHKVQVEHDLGVSDDPPVDIFRFADGSMIVTDLDMDTLPLWVMRSMSPRCRVADPQGVMREPGDAADLWKEAYREETALDDEVRARLEAFRPAGQSGDFVPISRMVSPLVKRARAVRDEAAWYHWDMVRRYGQGLRDGDFWLCRDGRVVPLTAVEKARPMTRADHVALQEDHKRADRWRADPYGAGEFQNEARPDPSNIGPVDYSEHLVGVAQYVAGLGDNEREAYLTHVSEAAAVFIRAWIDRGEV